MSDLVNFAAIQATQAQSEPNAGPRRRRREKSPMNNPLLEELAGREVVLTLGGMNGSVKGTVVRVRENWIELQTKKQTKLINADYVTGIQERE